MNTTLVNSIPVEVTYRDATTEKITIGKLSIRGLYTFLKLLGESDTPGLVALCAGKPIAWVDSLTIDSFKKLADAAIGQNFNEATELAKSDPVALGKIGPLLIALEGVASKFIEMSGSNGSGASPTPAPAESAAATGSASST